MGYNPQNAKEEPTIPADQIFDGAIISIKDGKVRDFVKPQHLIKWNNPDGSAIEVEVEMKYNERSHTLKTIFSYEEDNGATKFSSGSNLGKFNKKYGKLPEVGVVVKVMSNSDGFLRLKLD